MQTEDAMVAQVKDIVARQPVALIEDLAGVTALFASLYACLVFTL
jgi:dihydroneopterin aldolase